MHRRLAVLCLLATIASSCAPAGIRFAIDGAVVRNAATALASANQAFNGWLDDVPHNRADEASCYLPARRSASRVGDYHTEFEAWCGPALTLEHEPDIPWSIVTLEHEIDAGGRVTVTSAGTPRPASRQPGGLLRADGEAAPSEVVALEYPEPPALAIDHVGAVEGEIATSAVEPSAVETFAFRGTDGQLARVAIEARFAPTFGADRDLLIAPDGHELLLLDLDQHRRFRPGAVEVVLDIGGQQRALDADALESSQLVLVVPASAAVVLRVQEGDVAQTLDVRIGAMERDARATIALDRQSDEVRVGLELSASWTSRHVIRDDYFGDFSYDGRTYDLSASCERGTTSVFDGRGWAPEGTQVVTIECDRIEVDYGAELRSDALNASARLRIGGVSLEPVAVVSDGTSHGYSWGDAISATFVFHVPVSAENATFVLQGHAYIPPDLDIEGGVRAFSPAASADITLRERN